MILPMWLTEGCLAALQIVLQGTIDKQQN